MQSFTITYDGYDRYKLLCNSFKEKAGEYCPSPSELKYDILEKIRRDPKNKHKYLQFIIWILETGTETEENKKNRDLLRQTFDSMINKIYSRNDQYYACTFDTYDRFCDICDNMIIQADEYVPDIESFYNILNTPVFSDEHVPAHIPFFIWLDVTGKETPKTKDIRTKVNKYLREHLEFIESEDELEGDDNTIFCSDEDFNHFNDIYKRIYKKTRLVRKKRHEMSMFSAQDVLEHIVKYVIDGIEPEE